MKAKSRIIIVTRCSLRSAYYTFNRFSSFRTFLSSCETNLFSYSYLHGIELFSGYTVSDFTRTVTYEPHRSLITSVNIKQCSTTIFRYDYAYDAAGRRLASHYPDGTAAPGYTPLVTRTIYQNLTEGDIVTIDEKGRETVSCSDSWGDSRWGDGIPYSLSRSYADGSPAHEESFWSSNIATDTPWDQGEISHWQSWDESVSADGVLVRHSRSGGSIYDFSLQQQIYHADFIESETVEETFTGRVIRTARPGYGGATIKTVNHYDGGGRVTAVETWSENPTDSTLLSRTIYTYDELGQPLLTCQDLDLDGIINPASTDRASGSDTRYLLINGDWWHQHTSWIYPEADFLLPLTNAITRTRLTGLGADD